MFWGSRCVYIRKPSWWEGGGGRAEAAPAPAPGARQLTPSRCAEAPAWLPQPASNWASEARQCGPEPLRSRGPPSPWHRTEEGVRRAPFGAGQGANWAPGTGTLRASPGKVGGRGERCVEQLLVNVLHFQRKGNGKCRLRFGSVACF